MKIQMVVVGGTKGDLGAVIGDFESRCGHYWKLDVREVVAGVRGRDPSPDQVRKAEAERIEDTVDQRLDLWVLTRDGKSMTSTGLADTLAELALRSGPGVAFVIGGAFGLDEGILKRAARRFSLSTLTLPHEVARLILTEQLYRAGTILRGEPYHKGPGADGGRP